MLEGPLVLITLAYDRYTKVVKFEISIVGAGESTNSVNKRLIPLFIVTLT